MLSRIAAGTAVVFAAWVLLLCYPQPLFSSVVRHGHITLHSDRPLPAVAATRVLVLAEANLAKSPLFTGDRSYDVYICNARWRQVIFFNKAYGVGGVSLYPLTTNVFLRDSRVEDNRLISPLGTPVAADRPLDYFIAHEITHVLTGTALGPVRSLFLPQWVREGYADHIGKGSVIDLDVARAAFLADAPEMDYQRSGLYRRFHLLVAWSLQHDGFTVQRLLHDPPLQSAVESAVKSR